MSKILIFEGFDKSGKSSLINEINKITNYKYFMLDRGPASYIAYNNLLNKNFNNNDYILLKNILSNKLTLQICLTATPEEVKRRFKECNEPPLKYNQKIEDHIIEFNKQYKSSSFFNKIIIDNTNLKLKDTVKLVMNKIEEIENEHN